MHKLLTRKDLERELADARRQLEAQDDEIRSLRARMESARMREFFEKFYEIVERYRFSVEEAQNILASDLAQAYEDQWETSQKNVITQSLEELVGTACASEMGRPAVRRALQTAKAHEILEEV